jgi:transcriptional regulator with XRE-family HTH domain
MSQEELEEPHHGQIIAEYRKHKNWTHEDLALALRVHPRTVQRLEEKPMIKSVSRRRFVAGMLGIPVALLGLETSPTETLPFRSPTTEDRMTFYEEELALRWEVYFTGGTARAAHGLSQWIEEITEIAHAEQSPALHQRALALLTMSYQLQNCLFRDRLDFPQAHQSFKLAYQVARELGDWEYLAAALAREGVTYIQEKKPAEATKLLGGAVKIIRYRGLPNLKGHILQALGEAQAMTGDRQESLRSLGLAEHALEIRSSLPEHSLARFTASSVIAHRGIAAALLKDHRNAISLLDKSLIAYDPTMIRGRARLLAQKAEAYFGLSYIEECSGTAEETIYLARSVRSSRTETLIRGLYHKMQGSRWQKEPAVARLGAVLNTYPSSR